MNHTQATSLSTLDNERFLPKIKNKKSPTPFMVISNGPFTLKIFGV